MNKDRRLRVRSTPLSAVLQLDIHSGKLTLWRISCQTRTIFFSDLSRLIQVYQWVRVTILYKCITCVAKRQSLLLYLQRDLYRKCYRGEPRHFRRQRVWKWLYISMNSKHITGTTSIFNWLERYPLSYCIKKEEIVFVLSRDAVYVFFYSYNFLLYFWLYRRGCFTSMYYGIVCLS